MTTIRAAIVSDYRHIARVHVSAWRSAYRGILQDSFLDSLNEDDRADRWSHILQRSEQATFVAEVDDDGIIGFVNGGPRREGPEEFRGELYAIYILDEWRRHGVGKKLVATFTQWLTDSDFDSMLIWVLDANRCRLFYERVGGRIVDRKQITIGQQQLDEVAYGWDALHDLRGG